ncbi:MAG: TetR/AcrR family transcriptional regulator [Coriobacteriia bacterium]|nr:TetR/AcrR family transcriptional regulator [Coriobacteriia bacterium]
MAARPANPALAVDILRVTTDLIDQNGFEALKLREVAERLGISATTIYLYYKDKGQLLDAAVDRAFDWFADAQDQAVAGTSVSGVDLLRARNRGYVTWGIEHPNLYRLMFERPQGYSPDRSGSRRRSFYSYIETVKRLTEEGVLRPSSESAESMVSLTWAMNHGLVSLIISGRMFGPIGETISAEEAKKRILHMVDASMEQWLRAWAVDDAYRSDASGQ